MKEVRLHQGLGKVVKGRHLVLPHQRYHHRGQGGCDPLWWKNMNNDIMMNNVMMNLSKSEYGRWMNLKIEAELILGYIRLNQINAKILPGD